jgi:hypothetical protein
VSSPLPLEPAEVVREGFGGEQLGLEQHPLPAPRIEQEQKRELPRRAPLCRRMHATGQFVQCPADLLGDEGRTWPPQVEYRNVSSASSFEYLPAR